MCSLVPEAANWSLIKAFQYENRPLYGKMMQTLIPLAL